MGKPRQRHTINRNIERYIVVKQDLPVVVLVRDIVLTCIAWLFFVIAFYHAFLYIKNSWINYLPNITDQQPVSVNTFMHDMRIYLPIIVVVLAYVTLRLLYNVVQWRNSENSMVSLPVVSVEEQALLFHASPYQVAAARESKICTVTIDTETGHVSEIEIN